MIRAGRKRCLFFLHGGPPFSHRTVCLGLTFDLHHWAINRWTWLGLTICRDGGDDSVTVMFFWQCMIIANVEDKGLLQINNFPIPGLMIVILLFSRTTWNSTTSASWRLASRLLLSQGWKPPCQVLTFNSLILILCFWIWSSFNASTFSLTLYLDGEELEAELIEGQEEVISFGNILVAFFFIIASQSSRTLFQDDVTAFAKLDPTDRVQHVVCEAKNEVWRETEKLVKTCENLGDLRASTKWGFCSPGCDPSNLCQNCISPNAGANQTSKSSSTGRQEKKGLCRSLAHKCAIQDQMSQNYNP